MIIPLLGLLALLSPLVTGGRLRRFGDLRLRQAVVLPIALITQVVIIEVIPEANHAALSAVHIATYVAAGWFVWVNRAVPGLWIIALGAASNGITIAVNGGTLPATRSALSAAGIHPKPGEFLNSGVLAHPHLSFLGDVFVIPDRFPLSNVFSVGDALIVIGVFWAAQRICGSRLAPGWQPQTEPADDATLKAAASGADAVPPRQERCDMTDDSTSLPTYDILAPVEPDSGRKPAAWWAIGGVVALVAALIAGITYGAASLSGGGSQPEDALPAGAVAFAKVDLDPAAGQKVDAIRFLRKFPSLRGHLAADADLRKVLFEAVADDAGWAKVNFARDVEPWLGQRVGVAAYSAKMFAHGASAGRSQSPTVVVALQVGDEDKARAGLDRLIATSTGSDKPGYVVQDGYALLADSASLAASAADAVAKATMADSSTFAKDIKGLDKGIATFWVDGAAANSLSSVSRLYGLGLPSAPGGKGAPANKARMVFSLRFDGPDVLEVAGRVTGSPEIAGPNAAVKNFADLPGTTVAAIGLAGGDGVVDSAWTALRKQVGSSKGAGDVLDNAVREAESQYGIRLPDDLKLLLGTNMLVALDRTGLDDMSLNVGARVTTSDPKRADTLIGRLLSDSAGSLPGVHLVHRVTGHDYVVASSGAQADRMTASPGAKPLGDLDAFRRALPDVAGARFAIWVDPQSILSGMGQPSADLKPIAGFGLTATSDGSGTGSFRARLVTR